MQGESVRLASDRVISTVDPDTRRARETRERRQHGFKAHLVVEPETGLTTAVCLTRANGPQNSDANVGAALVTGPTINTGTRFSLLSAAVQRTQTAGLAAPGAGRFRGFRCP